MVYAPNPDFIDWASEAGANWVVVDSFGHLGNDSGGLRDDVPALLAGEPEIAKRRRPHAAHIDREVERVNALIEQAHARGMQAALACYQVALPAEARDVFPDLWRPPVKEIQRVVPKAAWRWSPCLSDKQLRDLLTLTVAEVISAFPAADGFIYSFHESMFNATITHRCEQCRDIPYPHMLRYLYDCMRAGVDRARSSARLFVRCWGLLHSEEVYWANARRAHEQKLRLPGKPIPTYAPDIEPLRYSPQRDFPQFLEALRGEKVTFVSKLTYGDYNLGQPTNPWIGRIKGFEHIGELSFEHVSSGKWTFTLIPDHVQRLTDVARRAGLAGLALVPYSWGVRGTHLKTWRFSADTRAGLGLNAGNFAIVAEAFAVEPRPCEALHEWLCRRYGQAVVPELARLLAETEQISIAMFTWNGVSYLMNFDLSHHWGVMDSLISRRSNALWYASHYEDGLARIEPTKENFARVRATQDGALAGAERLLDEAGAATCGLSAEARDEIMGHLRYYRDWMEVVWLSQRIMLRLWQWETDGAAITPQDTEEVLTWMSRRTYLAANSPHLKGMWFDHLK
jgi:hypothetical protein